jgi:hypothetical protein
VEVRRPQPAIALLLSLVAAPAIAQNASAPVGPVDHSAPGASPGTSSEPLGAQLDLRPGGEPRRNGLIAAYRVRENISLGVGRFSVPEIARPRTHMESDRSPTAIRPREGRIAAIGVSLSF